jgi:hypothetical protein
LCITLVIYQESFYDARSIKCKTFFLFLLSLISTTYSGSCYSFSTVVFLVGSCITLGTLKPSFPFYFCYFPTLLTIPFFISFILFFSYMLYIVLMWLKFPLYMSILPLCCLRVIFLGASGVLLVGFGVQHLFHQIFLRSIFYGIQFCFLLYGLSSV